MKRTFSRFDIELLADFVVCRSRVDPTESDSKNLRAGWRADQLLQDLDAFVVGQENDPAAYAEIVELALAQYRASGGESSEIIALLRLAIFRGERLLPVSSKRKSKLSAVIAELEANISSLPAGSRKERCRSLFAYHQGVFYDAYEMFAEGAKLQGQSAEIAQVNGDKPGESIGYFLERVYLLKQAMVDGDQAAMGTAFTALEQRFNPLVEAVRGTPLEVSWGQGNVSIHMIEALVWLNRWNHPALDVWVAMALAASEKLGQAWQPGARFVRAAYLDSDDNQEAEAALTGVANDTEQTNELRATALLILARRSLAGGCQSGIQSGMMPLPQKTAAELIAQMPETGAQHVRAIAARLLA